MNNIILRYLIFIIIPYVIASRIEMALWNILDPEEKEQLRKKLKEWPKYSSDALATPSREKRIKVWLLKLILEDFGLKGAVGGAIYSYVCPNTANGVVSFLAKYSSAIIMTPGHKLIRLVKRIKRVTPSYTKEIKEILFNNNITNQDKWELIRLKVKLALKHLKGSKRRQFILFLIALLLFNGGGSVDDFDNIQDYVVEYYQEYNTTLPREVVETLSV